jgi:serine/threonine-protein kinase
VAISESGQTRTGSRYIVMEYVDGITLRDFVAQRGGRLPVPLVLRISRQVASTLAAAHDKQIVHRDLKPANIMLVRDASDREAGASEESATTAAGAIPEKLKILDFGIAKIGGEGIGQTRTGVAMGTPIYMSPEQCRSGRNAVDRSDVYALGIIAYELLAGAPPFQGGAAVLMAAHLMQEPPPLASQAPEAPPALVSLIHSMLAKSPSDRPSAAEVARKLAELSGARTSASKAYAILPGERAEAADPTEVMADEALSQVGAQSALHAVPIRLRGKLLAIAAVFLLLLGLLLVLLLWTLARQPVGPPASPAQRSRGGPMRPIGLAVDGAAEDGDRDGGSGDTSANSTSPAGRQPAAVSGPAQGSKPPAVKAKPKKSPKKKTKAGSGGSRRSTK